MFQVQRARKENSMLCILKDLITCNAVFLHQHSWFMIFLTQHSKNSHRGPRDSLPGKGMDYNFWHGLRFLMHHSWLYCSQRTFICSNFQDLFTAAHTVLKVIPKNINPSLPCCRELFLQFFQNFSPYQSKQILFSLLTSLILHNSSCLSLKHQHLKAVFSLMPKSPGHSLDVHENLCHWSGRVEGESFVFRKLVTVACLCWAFWVKVQADVGACSFVRVPALIIYN